MTNKQPTWSRDDHIVALTEMLHNLMAWMVMAKIAAPEKMVGIIETTAKKLESSKQPRAAVALRTTFSGALKGEWASMQKLIDPEQNGGST